MSPTLQSSAAVLRLSPGRRVDHPLTLVNPGTEPVQVYLGLACAEAGLDLAPPAPYTLAAGEGLATTVPLQLRPDAPFRPLACEIILTDPQGQPYDRQDLLVHVEDETRWRHLLLAWAGPLAALCGLVVLFALHTLRQAARQPVTVAEPPAAMAPALPGPAEQTRPETPPASPQSNAATPPAPRSEPVPARKPDTLDTLPPLDRDDPEACCNDLKSLGFTVVIDQSLPDGYRFAEHDRYRAVHAIVPAKGPYQRNSTIILRCLPSILSVPDFSQSQAKSDERQHPPSWRRASLCERLDLYPQFFLQYLVEWDLDPRHGWRDPVPLEQIRALEQQKAARLSIMSQEGAAPGSTVVPGNHGPILLRLFWENPEP